MWLRLFKPSFAWNTRIIYKHLYVNLLSKTAGTKLSSSLQTVDGGLFFHLDQAFFKSYSKQQSLNAREMHNCRT